MREYEERGDNIGEIPGSRETITRSDRDGMGEGKTISSGAFTT